LGKEFFGGFQSICFGFGFALMIGILASGGVSGGHLNPGISLNISGGISIQGPMLGF
jgi:glycerol uptake facilitator-like aquaporin